MKNTNDALDKLRDSMRAERNKTAKVKPSDALEILLEDLTWWKLAWFSTKCSFLFTALIGVVGLIFGVPLWLLWQLFFVVLA